MQWIAKCAAVVATSLAASVGTHQYPVKSILWISPHAAGGGTDLTTRLVAQKMGVVISQPIVVDNRFSSSGNIGG